MDKEQTQWRREGGERERLSPAADRTAQDKDSRRIAIPLDVTEATLRDLLICGGVPVEQFGTGGAKGIDDLVKEVHEGESIMAINEDGSIYREVSVLWADIYCSLEDGSVYQLFEDRQEFKDGRVKRRSLSTSIGEKMQPLERPEEALTRALSEELGVQSTDAQYAVGYSEEVKTPDTYPIESFYKAYRYAAIIPAEAFLAEGYVEYQEKKTNYYLWKQIYSENA